MALGDLIGRLLGSNQTFMPGEQQVAQGGGATPPFWGQVTNDLSAPASSPSLFGVPIMPLLAGVGGAFLNQSLAKRAHRNEALGSGFASMYSLFNEPIRRQQHEQQRMREIMLQQGWGLPFDPNADTPAAPPVGGIPPMPLPSADLNQTSSTDADFHKAIMSGLPVTPSVTPAPTTRLAGTPGVPATPTASKVLFNYGGMPIYANPTPRVSIGDLGLGLNLGPSVSGYKMPMSPQVLDLAFKGAERQSMRNYAKAMNIPEDTPFPIMQEQVKQNLLEQRMEKGLNQIQGKLGGDNTSIQYSFQDGMLVPHISIASPQQAAAQQARLAMAQQGLTLQGKQIEATEANTARAQEQLDFNKMTKTAQALGFQRDAVLRENTQLTRELQNPLLSEDRNKEIQVQLQQNRAKLESITKQEEPIMNALYKDQNIERPQSAISDPEAIQLQQLGQGYAKQIMAMPSVMAFEKFPKPKSGPELRAYNFSLQEAKRTLDEIVPVIQEVMKDRWLPGITGIPTTTMTWLNNAYDSTIVDFAIRNWKAGYKPSRSIPESPVSQSVPSAPTGQYE